MKTFFPDIPEQIPFEGPGSKNPLAFKYYNPTQMVGEKTMAEHMRFSVAYWHTFRATGQDPFGAPTFVRPWIEASSPIEQAEYTVRAAFEFAQKLDASLTYKTGEVTHGGEFACESCGATIHMKKAA